MRLGIGSSTLMAGVSEIFGSGSVTSDIDTSSSVITSLSR